MLQQGECTPWGLWSVSGKRCYEDFVRFGILLGDFVEGSRKLGFALHWILSGSINSVVVLLNHFNPEDQKDGVRLNWNL